jgi:glycosyltransferase involved in cell wall biosynthesis
LSRIRLTYVVGEMFPFGGLQRHVEELIEYFSKLDNVDCSLICSEKVSGSGVKEYLSEKYPNLNLTIVKTIGWNSIRLFSPMDFMLIVRAFRMSDIVHLHDIRFLLFTLIFSRTNGKRLLSSHGFIFHNGFSVVKKVIFFIYVALINNFFSLCICISRSDLKIAECYRMGNAVLRENWTKKVFREALFKENKIIYFGRLEESKGVRELCSESFVSRLRNESIELVVVGTGALSEFVDSQSKLLGFTYLGYVSHRELDLLLRRYRYAIFPSTREGFGLTILEALSADMICFLRRESNYPEIFPSGPLHFFSFDDFDDMLRKINTAFSRCEVSDFLKGYSFDSACDWYANLYGVSSPSRIIK